MHLNDYLRQQGAMSLEELTKAIGAKSSAQIRQWRNPSNQRRPSPRYCTAIERATGGAVRRQDLRSDWRDIWPELDEERVA